MYGQEQKQLISLSQKNRAFALMNDICDYTGYKLYELYSMLKESFTDIMDMDQLFSLSPAKCDIITYNQFMDYVLDLYFDLGCSSSESIQNYFANTDAYVKRCLKRLVCCIDGSPHADIHHCTAIGMGNNRKMVDHSEYPRMPLSRKYHVRVHTIGQQAFEELFHVRGVYSNYHKDKKDIIDGYEFLEPELDESSPTHIFDENQVTLTEINNGGET